MHHIYKTEGLIIGSSLSGEANKFFYIFTRDLGLIGASAQGVRRLQSKLRYSLQDFSLSQISLVRGKNNWKITNAIFDKNFYQIFNENSDKLFVCSQIFSLLKKLLAGEDKNEKLLDVVKSSLVFLEQSELGSEEIKNFECIVVLKILHNLGYLGQSENLKKFIEEQTWSLEFLSAMNGSKKEAIENINKSIKETQL
jgi:DNA repair protein RecO